MSGRLSFALALTCAALAAGSAPAAPEIKEIKVVRLHSTIEVALAPSAVWAHVTQGKSLVTWCPVWKSAANAKVDLTRVGDVLDFTDEWGNNGRSVVTYLVKDQELRVAHEPNDGSYMCQAKIVLSPSGKGGTLVRYYEQYTDESKPEEMKATAAQMESGMQATLAALKKAAEKR